MSTFYRSIPTRPRAARATLLAATAAALIAGGATTLAQPPGPPGHEFRVATFVDGLRNPWSIAFLPNGDMLVTERGGTLRIVRDGRLLPDPVPGVPAVRALGQGGLHDVVLHPNFASNQILYLSYAKPGADPVQGTTALSRARFVNDRLENVEEIFEAQAWTNTPGHFGGRIAFDRDGYLYLSIGDRMQGFEQGGFTRDLEGHPSQDTTNHMGTIVRLRDDGSVPDDNPFVGRAGALPEIWSYGHRNPQGLAFHPETGDLWSTEHGPQGGDELNVILPGRNYGWPVVGYGANYGSGTEIHRARHQEGMEGPAAFWVPSIGASGLAVYAGDAFPNWRGNAFAGGLARGYGGLVRVSLNGTTVAGREPLLTGDPYRVREVRVGPDGLIYIALDHTAGSIIRLEPVASSN
jgi:aldose sugar dehydrogenase